jgi:hypothetical protein
MLRAFNKRGHRTIYRWPFLRDYKNINYSEIQQQQQQWKNLSRHLRHSTKVEFDFRQCRVYTAPGFHNG